MRWWSSWAFKDGVLLLYSRFASQMGSYLSRNEQEISESLREEYDIEAQPYLLHRRSQQLCTLHKLTAGSPAEAERIRQAVEEYQRTRCESISKLRTHYHLASSGYCSDEQSFFLVFEGQNSYSLREESAKRRLYRTAFHEGEIQQVAETLLCGLREYDHRFQRDYERLSLDSLLIDQQTHRLYLRDPWLGGEAPGQGDPLTSLLLHYPSPEKLRAAHSSNCEDYKELLSNLFSVGAIALELKRLEFADGIYLKKREVNYEEIRTRLGEFASERLRKGLECLLDPSPNERKKIYQMWGIENKEEHYLEPILAQQEEVPSPITKIHTREYASPTHLSKFHPSTSQLPPQGLKAVPSEASIVPPLSIHQSGKAPEPLSSRSNRSDHVVTPQPLPQNYQQKPTFSHIPTSNNVHFQPQQYQNFTPFQQKSSQPLIYFNQKPKPSQFPAKPSSSFIPPPPSFSEIYNRKLAENHQQSSTGQSHVPVYLPPPTVASSAVSKPQSNGWSFNPLADYKESIYEPLQRPSHDHSLQTYTESPPKEREIKSILLEDKHEAHPPIEKSPSIIDKILADNLQPHEQAQATNPQEKKEKQAIAVNNLLDALKEESLNPPVLQDNNYEPCSPDTPNRPTAKNKYNSTIVEVRDEDSPLHSERSEEVLEEEYVVEEYETGSRYEGFKSGGMRNGRGKFYYQDGGYYEGQWRNNKMDGEGRLYYEGGKLAYEGSWAQDEFNGAGKVYNDNPVPLEAAFDFTNFELLEDYWEYYEGMLVRDTKEGRGKIKLSNGEVFEGDFHNDRIQGFGKFYSRDGKVVEGIWRESKLIKIINAER